ncbi:MAG TPA: hypothetical protein VE981_14365 [Planctomycetota bacterium]|nr:hypothetical protein [Planctomycetota bacterium]
MKKLVVVRAMGLSADQAVRGDVAWNVSDLIAEGSFAAIAGTADLDKVASGLAADRVTVVDVPYKDAASFDDALGKLRAGATGAAIAILSESVFISQQHFREIKPGSPVAGTDVPRLLAAMLA